MLFSVIFTLTALTSSFGENRGIRFHMGIDISTNKKSGIPIYSPFKGIIVRIKDSWKGYGRALYIKKEEKIFVYAHLEGFPYNIEKKLYKEKKKRKKHEIELYLNLPADSGEIIGYTGNSGTRIPHIHLETRRDFSVCVNPLYYTNNIIDTEPPFISKIIIYPLSYSKVNRSFLPLEISYPFPDTVFVTSEFWLWISCYDYQSSRENKLAPYKLETFIDDSLIFSISFDSISYNDNYAARAIYTKKSPSFSESFIHPLPMDKSIWYGHTFIHPKKNKYILKIKAYDFSGNSHEVSLWVKKKDKEIKKMKELETLVPVLDGIVLKREITPKELKNFNYTYNINKKEYKIFVEPGKYGKFSDFVFINPLPGKNYVINLKKFKIRINKNTLFFPYPLLFQEKEDTLKILSVPLLFKNKIKIKWKKNDSKEVIFTKKNSISNFFSSDSIFYIYGEGIFYIKKDTIPPQIYLSDKVYIQNNTIKFYLKGEKDIKEIEFYIDDEWEPVLFNPLTGEVKIKIFRNLPEKEYEFRVIVKDFVDNKVTIRGKSILNKKF